METLGHILYPVLLGLLGLELLVTHTHTHTHTHTEFMGCDAII